MSLMIALAYTVTEWGQGVGGNPIKTWLSPKFGIGGGQDSWNSYSRIAQESKLWITAEESPQACSCILMHICE